MVANFKYHTRLLSKFGRKSFLIGAAVVTGVALCTNRYSHVTWGNRLHACQHSQSSWDSNWDKRGSSTPNSALASKSKRHIMLMRHGQYNQDGETDSQKTLTEVGQFQAMVTGERLNEIDLPFMRIVASTMTRARQTAHLVRQNEALCEVTLEFDKVLEEGAPVTPMPPTENWKPHPSQFFQDGARIENAFRTYFHRADPDQSEDSYELIVCHANVIRYFVCRALQFPPCGWIRISLANCSLTMVTIHPDGLVVVEMIGDHGHIPPESVTYH